jgi:hypothetical protein
MKTWIKVFLGMIILGVFSFLACIVFSVFSPSKDVLVESVAYHTKDELVELYSQNKVLLSRVKDSMLSNEKVLQKLIDEQDGDTAIYQKQDEPYFSQEEWHDILTISESFHPTMLMLERKGRPLIFYLAFGHLKRGSTTYTTYLYWFPNDEERAYHEEDGVFPDGVFTQIDDGWYVVETTNTR